LDVNFVLAACYSHNGINDAIDAHSTFTLFVQSAWTALFYLKNSTLSLFTFRHKK